MDSGTEIQERKSNLAGGSNPNLNTNRVKKGFSQVSFKEELEDVDARDKVQTQQMNETGVSKIISEQQIVADDSEENVNAPINTKQKEVMPQTLPNFKQVSIKDDI